MSAEQRAASRAGLTEKTDIPSPARGELACQLALLQGVW